MKKLLNILFFILLFGGFFIGSVNVVSAQGANSSTNEPNQSVDQPVETLPIDTANTSSDGPNASVDAPVETLPIDTANTSSDGANQSVNPSYYPGTSESSAASGSSGGSSGAGSALRYNFIEKLPGIGPFLTSRGPGTLFADYAGSIYTLIIGFAAILAFLMMVVGGVQYTLAAVPSAKNDAKGRILNALLGLFIVLGAYLILRTINPKLVEINLAIQTLPYKDTPGLGSVVGGPSPVSSGSLVGSPGIHVDWSEEREIENRIKLGTLGVGVNRNTWCGGTGSGQGCTDVAGLSDRVIDSVGSLKAGCETAYQSGSSSNTSREWCSVVITGGTEPGHQTHGGGNRADISQGSSALNNYIRTSGTQTTCPDNSSWTAYRVGSGTYCDERVGGDPHWHVVYE